ncbi:hypothetical protein SEUCBS139899_008241 [Sporothrix eucalyptigena]|uniref:Uncharacterized protein n=1 Tax=Sporothrix eucalyptigena TaxID=1812306 RepID=A0ABP0CF55_9PEZI
MNSPLAFFVVAALASTAAAQSCFEGTNLVCYGLPGGTSQNISLDDLQFAADTIRFNGQSSDPTDLSGFYTMPANPKLHGCDEWTVLDSGTVRVLAKHTNNAVNSSVLLEDMASTIDGGSDATDAQKAKAIIHCAEHGGQLVITANTSNPAYSSAAYKASGNHPTDMMVKVVKVV